MINTYQSRVWNNYAQLHSSVSTSTQLALFYDAIKPLYGSVVDCGCGSAKIAPLLESIDAVTHYTGLDASPSMVEVAGSVIARSQLAQAHIEHTLIEDHRGLYDSAISIHSYYTWPEPIKVLRAIAAMLPIGGTFVLATPNPQLDMTALVNEARRELIDHPNFEEFVLLNQQLASEFEANLDTLDQVLNNARAAGFALVRASQEHYRGGANLLEFTRRE
ncbi:MAG: class I SAM-dependent methyltransferase [Pseudomonadales bacterium]